MCDYRGERKTLLYFCLYDMDIETMENSQLEGTDQRSFLFWPTEALTKDFATSLWIRRFNKNFSKTE